MRRRGQPAGGPVRVRAAAAAALAAALLLAGCAQSVDPIERLGKRAAQGARQPSPADGAAYRRWGLTAPLAAPPSHPARPLGTRRTDAAPPPVVDRVDTTDRVVFLTYDDGAERDPRFVDMVRELRLPVSFFLTDSVVGPGYGHFARLRAVGAAIENHTLDHPALPGLPYAGQRAEICGQQDRLASRFGVRPRLFRPPYGTYDANTLRAAAGCGISTVVLWRAALDSEGIVYRGGAHRLRPGDIVLVGPDEAAGPTLTQRTIRLLRHAQSEGLTVARLEDYLA
ncbi:polysaccharide deacetylase family protein [Streptomyces sp. NPDC004596]|uniref:polysaccharide deacetylase family protein n=1 Tax=Streptomyces sp. DSM 118148 TaxID=3448667 RepID=UPI00403FFD62